MRRLLAGVLALSLGGLALAWDDPKTEGKKDPPTRADRLKAVQKDYADAMTALGKDFQKAETDKEKDEIREKAQKLRPKAADRAIAIAKEDPKDDVGFLAIQYAMTMGAGTPVAKTASEFLLKYHVENPKIADMVLSLGRGGSEETAKFLKAVLEKNPDKTAKGRAAYAMIQLLADKIEKAKTDTEAAAIETEALGYITRVEKEFGDVTQFTLPKSSKAEPRLLGKIVAREAKSIPNIRKLMVGKTVPEVEGEDVDGAKFKLSDYRGKVVMVDFWGHW
ncbi:MAG TPA: hypothetical protein VGJ05_11005 [Fimbriiglobus sp.]|jgi:hypothetical protein